MDTNNRRNAPLPSSSLAQRRQRVAQAAPAQRHQQSSDPVRITDTAPAQRRQRVATATLSRRKLDPRTFIGVGLALLAVVLLVRAMMLSHRAATASPAVSSSHSSGSPAPQVGHPAPAATFLDASNHQVTLASFQGKVVVLNFWYAACDPCQIEMPALEHTYQADQAKGLVVLGADTIDDAQTMTDFTQRLGITYPVVRDPDARTAIAFGVIGTPTSFIVDQRGIIRYKITGPVDHETLVKDVTTLLSQT